jgi:hypothetical protein
MHVHSQRQDNEWGVRGRETEGETVMLFHHVVVKKGRFVDKRLDEWMDGQKDRER